MTVSSRTPEGLPSHCPLCGEQTNLEYSATAEDVPCPSCGYLLWKSEQVLDSVQNSVAESFNLPAEEISVETLFEDLRADSLDLVELVMELEDEFDVTLPDDDYEQLRTIGDLVRYIIDQQLEDSE